MKEIPAYLCFIELINNEHFSVILWEPPGRIRDEASWITVEVVYENKNKATGEIIEVRQTRVFNPRHIIQIVLEATTNDSSEQTRNWEKVIKTEIGTSIKKPEGEDN